MKAAFTLLAACKELFGHSSATQLLKHIGMFFLKKLLRPCPVKERGRGEMSATHSMGLRGALRYSSHYQHLTLALPIITFVCSDEILKLSLTVSNKINY